MSVELGNADSCESFDLIIGDGWGDCGPCSSGKSNSKEYDEALAKWIFVHPHPSSRFQFTKSASIQPQLLSETDAKVEVVAGSRNVKMLPREVSGSITGSIKFGGEDGPTYEVKASGSVSDNNGNSATLTGSHNSEGETTVSFTAETKKE
jgi:hypothetical protein